MRNEAVISRKRAVSTNLWFREATLCVYNKFLFLVSRGFLQEDFEFSHLFCSYICSCMSVPPPYKSQPTLYLPVCTSTIYLPVYTIYMPVCCISAIYITAYYISACLYLHHISHSLLYISACLLYIWHISHSLLYIGLSVVYLPYISGILWLQAVPDISRHTDSQEGEGGEGGRTASGTWRPLTPLPPSSLQLSLWHTVLALFFYILYI